MGSDNPLDLPLACLSLLRGSGCEHNLRNGSYTTVSWLCNVLVKLEGADFEHNVVLVLYRSLNHSSRSVLVAIITCLCNASETQ